VIVDLFDVLVERPLGLLQFLDLRQQRVDDEPLIRGQWDRAKILPAPLAEQILEGFRPLAVPDIGVDVGVNPVLDGRNLLAGLDPRLQQPAELPGFGV